MGINVQATHEGRPGRRAPSSAASTRWARCSPSTSPAMSAPAWNAAGKHAETSAAWSMIELQELLDEWIVACWQNRPHDGLRHPVTPGKALTPNEMYAALVETAGLRPGRRLARDDYIELLPATWRRDQLLRHQDQPPQLRQRRRSTPTAGQHSGIDRAARACGRSTTTPTTSSRVWVRNHHDGGWISRPGRTCAAHPSRSGNWPGSTPASMLARRGSDQTTETRDRPGRRQRPARPRRTRAAATRRRPSRRKPTAGSPARTRASQPTWPHDPTAAPTSPHRDDAWSSSDEAEDDGRAAGRRDPAGGLRRPRGGQEDGGETRTTPTRVDGDRREPTMTLHRLAAVRRRRPRRPSTCCPRRSGRRWSRRRPRRPTTRPGSTTTPSWSSSRPRPSARSPARAGCSPCSTGGRSAPAAG